MKSIEEIAISYTDAAIAHYESTINGDYKKANKAHDKVVKCYKELKSIGEEGLNAIVELLNHPNHAVQGWSATHSLFIKPERAKLVIMDIIKNGDVHNSFNAKMVLSEWEKGKLKVNF